MPPTNDKSKHILDSNQIIKISPISPRIKNEKNAFSLKARNRLMSKSLSIKVSFFQYAILI